MAQYIVPGLFGGIYSESVAGENLFGAVGIFVDGAIPPLPPGPGSPALPTGMARARQDHGEWSPHFRRRFAFIATPAPASIAPFERFVMPVFADEWFPPMRRRFAFIAPAPATDDDMVVMFLF